MSMLPADTHRRLGVVLKMVPMDPKILLECFVKALPDLVLRAPPHNIADAERLELLDKLRHWLAVTVAIDATQQWQRLMGEEVLLTDLLSASEAAEAEAPPPQPTEIFLGAGGSLVTYQQPSALDWDDAGDATTGAGDR